jgi:RHS repeat-associated protein
MANRYFSAAPPVCSRKNVRESEDQLSQVSTFSYDNNGNRVSFRDANNVGQDCVYDARNRDTQCTDTMGSVTKKFYDAHNNLVKTTDALLKDNLCAYDARDRKINCTDRLGGVTQYAYDANNNLTTLTDAQNGVTSYIFDPRNLLIVETYPDTRSRTYTYDAIRRLIKRVDQTNTATAYVYDHAGRMVERVYPAGTGNDTFIYDNASRLTSAASARYNNVVNRAYDSASRILSEMLTVGATPYSIGYEYDADNRQTHVTYPDGSVVVRNFTDRNQLDVVTFNNALVANFNYDNAGRKVAANFGNGIVETRTYQADNLNTSINTPGVTSFGYTWDANKRKLTQTETGIPLNNQTYSYDDEDRLASFSRNNGDNQAWTLSLVGDWNQFNNNGNIENRTHNAVHEITTVDATPLVHDLKGNLTQNKNGQTYAWDIENRLLSATVPVGCPDGIAGTHTYAYDALGRRVSKTVGGNTTIFISDGMQEIAEYVNGAFSQSYVYGNYIDEPLLKTDNAGNKIYYHANNLFSVATLTDNNGTVVERYKYDPYGKATVLAADGITVRPNSLYGNKKRHQGLGIDTETGLYDNRARMFDPNLGQFISRDPIGYRGGINLYEYVQSKPIISLDPKGLEECKYIVWSWGMSLSLPFFGIGPSASFSPIVVAKGKNGTCYGIAIGAGASVGFGGVGGSGYQVGSFVGDCCPKKMEGNSWGVETEVGVAAVGGYGGGAGVGLDENGINGVSGGAGVMSGVGAGAAVRVTLIRWLYCSGCCEEEDLARYRRARACYLENLEHRKCIISESQWKLIRPDYNEPKKWIKHHNPHANWEDAVKKYKAEH